MSKKLKIEAKRLVSYFARNKTKVFRSLSLSLLLFFLAIAFAGLKALYPYHFLLSLAFLISSIYFFIQAFLYNHKKVVGSNIFIVVRDFIFKKKWWIVGAVVISFCSYALWTVIPLESDPFRGLNNSQISDLVENDLNIATVLLDNLELSGNELVNNPLLVKKTLTAEESYHLKNEWNKFLSVAIESEKVTDVHKHFTRINLFFHPKLHAESFIISYALYMKKFEIFYKLINKIHSDVVTKQLNEYSPIFGSKNSYDDVMDRFFSSDSLVRRNLGRFYVSFLRGALFNRILDEGYFVLEGESVKSHSYLLNNVYGTAVNAVKTRRYRLEKDLSDVWFPFQKNVANIMGESYVSSRHDKFITLEQITELKKSLEPGDILIERRNWYASNVGIPGFWAHAAMYFGTLDEIRASFKDLFPMNGYESLDALLEKEHPKLLKDMQTLDINSYAHTVIEGKAPGVILQSLEESAHADYLAVLRARLSKKDKLAAILRAFENYGKPYDYNFDFETRDEIVCSELIYDAYQAIGDKKGLHFPLTLTSGRLIVSPNDMVKKYYEERDSEGRELDFVYFLDGNEKLGQAFVKTEEDLGPTWQRPKYSWFQE